MGNKNFNEDELAKKLFKKLERERTSADFTSGVMDKIIALEAQKHQVKEYKPLISLKGWISIAASVVALVALVILTGGAAGSEATPYSGYIEKGNDLLGNLFAGAAVSPVIIMTALAFWGLFFLDKIMGKVARV